METLSDYQKAQKWLESIDWDDCPEADDNLATICYALQEIEKLAGYEKAFPVPPCAVGDKLYEPRPDRGIITEYRVISLTYSGHGWYIGWRLNSGGYSNLDGIPADKIGKTVFLTREEAEERIG